MVNILFCLLRPTPSSLASSNALVIKFIPTPFLLLAALIELDNMLIVVTIVSNLPCSKDEDVQHRLSGEIVKDAALTKIRLQVLKELFQLVELLRELKLFFGIVCGLVPFHQTAKNHTNNRLCFLRGL